MFCGENSFVVKKVFTEIHFNFFFYLNKKVFGNSFFVKKNVGTKNLLVSKVFAEKSFLLKKKSFFFVNLIL